MKILTFLIAVYFTIVPSFASDVIYDAEEQIVSGISSTEEITDTYVDLDLEPIKQLLIDNNQELIKQNNYLSFFISFIKFVIICSVFFVLFRFLNIFFR